MSDLKDIFADARNSAAGAREYEKIRQASDLSDKQKKQLALLDDIAKTLSTGGVKVMLDFSDAGMAIVITEGKVAVRIPFVLAKASFAGGEAIQPEFDERSLRAAPTGYPSFALDYDADKFVRALAQEMTLRGIGAMQADAARAYLDGRKPGTP